MDTCSEISGIFLRRQVSQLGNLIEKRAPRPSVKLVQKNIFRAQGFENV